MQLLLNGQWLVKNLTDNSSVFNGVIPSTNYNDLLKNNLILDPFLKTNENETLWVGDKDWSYSRLFNITSDILKSDRIELVTNCLDAIAEIHINKNLVSKTYNAHIGYRFSIKEYLLEGENQIEIIFRSPNKFAQEESKRIGKKHNVKGIDKRVFIRKNLNKLRFLF